MMNLIKDNVDPEYQLILKNCRIGEFLNSKRKRKINCKRHELFKVNSDRVKPSLVKLVNACRKQDKGHGIHSCLYLVLMIRLGYYNIERFLPVI